MTSFIGDILCKIEAKGRFLFPSVLKKQLENEQDKFVIKKDIYENCLVLYTLEEWQRQIDFIRSKLNPYNKEHSRFLREFYRDTAEITMDTSGRILVPKRLLDLANIKKEVYLLGLDTKIEIWAKEIYEKIEHSDEEFADLAQKLLGENNE
ncbi:MAG: cell division/cell wall cluster transcriptional repressor MraZ [Bacteroidales bacterium]|nr:cell division/cell wall cluster transcriptional repressor MraZ [Bacteroidales bacterium]